MEKNWIKTKKSKNEEFIAKESRRYNVCFNKLLPGL